MVNYISDFASEQVNRTSSYLKIESIEHHSKHMMFCSRSTKKTSEWCVATHWNISSSKQGSFSKFCWVKRQNSKYSATSYDGLITCWQVFSYSKKKTPTRMELYQIFTDILLQNISRIMSTLPNLNLMINHTLLTTFKPTLNHQTKPPNGPWETGAWHLDVVLRSVDASKVFRCVAPPGARKGDVTMAMARVLNHPSTF